MDVTNATHIDNSAHALRTSLVSQTQEEGVVRRETEVRKEETARAVDTNSTVVNISEEGKRKASESSQADIRQDTSKREQQQVATDGAAAPTNPMEMEKRTIPEIKPLFYNSIQDALQALGIPKEPLFGDRGVSFEGSGDNETVTQEEGGNPLNYLV